MFVVKQLFRFYINSSIHVALGVISLYILNAQHLNILVNQNAIGFLFFATIVCYNFVKYGVEAEKYLIVAKPSHRPIQVLSFLAFGACLYFFFQLPVRLWIVITVLTVISALYAIPFLPRSKNLRSLGGLKIFLVAVIWVGFVVVLQVLEHRLGFSHQVWFLGLQNYVLVLLLIIPFEIRDLKYDKEELKTLPQRWGVARTKQFGYALILVFLFIGIIMGKDQFRGIVFSCLSSVLFALMLFRTKQMQSTYFASFWVEAIPVMMLMLHWVLMKVID